MRVTQIGALHGAGDCYIQDSVSFFLLKDQLYTYAHFTQMRSVIAVLDHLALLVTMMV